MAIRAKDAMPGLDELPAVLTVEEAAVVLRISRGAAYELARQYRESGGRHGLRRAGPDPAGAQRSAPSLTGAGRTTVTVGDAQPVPAVVFGETARRLRRVLGPTAWSVLEELVNQSDPDSTAVINIARLADGVGIGVDAAGAAVRRLQDEGLIERLAQRIGSGGRFGPGGYRLHLPAGLVVAMPCSASPDAVNAETASRRGRRRVEQPGLFDHEPVGQLQQPADRKTNCANASQTDAENPTPR